MDGFEAGSAEVTDIVKIDLSTTDLNSLKLLDVPAIDDIYLLTTANMVKNTADFYVVPITTVNEFIPSKFSLDESVPLLVNVTLDMGLEVLTLQFDEPI